MMEGLCYVTNKKAVLFYNQLIFAIFYWNALTFQANIVRQILCMMEGLLPSMKNTDEDDYFMKPREKVDDDSGTVGIKLL